jgi:hypothetical protein
MRKETTSGRYKTGNGVYFVLLHSNLIWLHLPLGECAWEAKYEEEREPRTHSTGEFSGILQATILETYLTFMD